MIKKIFFTAAMSVSATAAFSDSLDHYDIYEGVETYDGGQYQTSFECITKTMTQFLHNPVTPILEEESWFNGMSAQYNAIVHFTDQRAESDIVTIDWIEVLQSERNHIEGDIYLSSSHVNFSQSTMVQDPSIPNTAFAPYKTNAYNQGFQIDPAMDASVLDNMLRNCPFAQGMPIS